ncbi:GGDEF domain-containing protein [Alteromonas sp. 5E99-2]|uniref:diguanylate cyclase n=1 Tax=Alteromonas sp. 5E99-2 TaxID=2817683 RepID=UPI001A996C25|nr:diguanylate cyclase [Alteromonas sp. 5E99-2]MBO1256285.1 GGDEF domain-containing protein [Alteromonas sp. 5E99-2]
MEALRQKNLPQCYVQHPISPASKLVLALLFLLFSLFFCSKSYSKDTYTERQVIDKVNALETETDLTHQQKIESLNSLITLSQSKQWRQALITSKILKIELMLHLELINEAIALVNEIKQVRYDELTAIEKSRVVRAELKFYSTRGFLDKLEESRSELLRYARIIEKENGSEFETLGYIYKAIGYSYFDNNELPLAIEYFKRAYSLFIAVEGSRKNIAVPGILSALGEVHTEVGEITKALEYFEEALGLYKERGNKFNQSVVLFNIGRAYSANKQPDTATHYFQQSMTISEEIDDAIGIVWSKQELGEIALQKEEWVLALALFNETLPAFIEENDIFHSYSAFKGKVKSYIQLGNLDRAQLELDKAITLAKQFKSPTQKLSLRLLEAELAHAKGDIDNLNMLFLDALSLQEDIHEIQQKRLVTRYRVEFDTQIKENQNRELTLQNQLNVKKIQRKETQNITWISVSLAFALCLIVIAFSLFKQVKMRKHFAKISLSDPLTNQPNRRAVIEFSQRAYDKALQTQQPLTIAIIDLDYFKRINDEFGHDVGDNVLKAFGRACKEVLRKQDYFGRYGGEEWMLVITDTNETVLPTIFERISAKLNKDNISGLPIGFEINFSMGAATTVPSPNQKLTNVVKMADNQLYIAKENGRNQLRSAVMSA